MDWFKGDIIHAIQTAKDNKSLFIVFVNGDDDKSRELLKTWQDERLGQLSSANKCVGLKLDSTSEAATQFSQIYPVMIFPTIYFIGNNGQPLEVCIGPVNADELLERFNKALELHHSSSATQQQHQPVQSTNGVSHQESESSGTSNEASAPQDSEGTASALPTSEMIESVAPPPTSEANQPLAPPTSEANQPLAPPTSDTDHAVDDNSPEAIAERAEKAKQLIAERQREKRRLQEEEEKKKEIERRKLGQDALKFKEWKEEMKRKETELSYKKEKEEARLAREKVRQDLERDRQERASKFYQEKTAKEEHLETVKRAKEEKDAQKQEKDNAVKRETARIQFRLPDGSSINQSFPSSEPLSVARSFILQRLNGVYRSISLSTTFPKRKFTEEDMSQTLLELELAPSAIVLVLPESSPGFTSHLATGDSSFIWLLLAPLLALWNFICNLLFSAPPPDPPQQQQQQQQASADPSPPQPSPSTSSSSDNPPRYGARRKELDPNAKGSNAGLRKRQDGNIHRLTADDEDDESATWNGNSTQQM